MKKLSVAVFSCFFVCLSASAQNPFTGIWEGKQTTMQGNPTGDIRFELTDKNEFLLKDRTTNAVTYRGSFTTAGNTISGKYIETIGSTGYVHFFTGTVDAGAKKLVCTYGNSPASNWLGKWTVVQISAPSGASSPAVPSVQKTDADYYLSVVTATIKTGNDNKEYPSMVDVDVYCGNMTWRNSHAFHLFYTNEIKKNSTANLIIPQRDKINPYQASENTLAAYKQYGLKFLIKYQPNIALDAWKIESLSLKLEFKDKDGNPHPAFGTKVITFGDSNLWMDGFDKRNIIYQTDKYFNALPVRQFSRNTIWPEDL